CANGNLGPSVDYW
nr:immunoglobulin heavy chain junction region [Macaca mulatta]MOW90442.1 immunoglobulin heavy chain junction region [Macaca mulatta]MOW92742.1 immunoglobulin heavy chain junction region [Macaca mulatta]